MLLGYDILGSCPLSSSRARDVYLPIEIISLEVVTYSAEVATGGVVESVVCELQVYEQTATISSSGAVYPPTLNILVNENSALVVTSGAILPTNAIVAFTTHPFKVKTAGYVKPESGAISITTYPVSVSTTAIIYASPENLVLAAGVAVVSTGGSVQAAAASIILSPYSTRIKMGRNPKLWQERQKFSPENLVVLFELDATSLGGTLMRFTSSATETDVISFGGNDYYPVPVEATGFESSGKGTLPTPVLRVLNTPTLQSGIISLKDLVGATLYRIRTFKTFLDTGSDPDPNAKFPMDIYKIERKTNHNKVYVEWELSAAMDQEGKMIPARQIIRDYCTHIYRVWNSETETFDYSRATCPYAGSTYRDANDLAVSAPNDRCGKRLSSCSARFGANAVLPTRAFPGVAKV